MGDIRSVSCLTTRFIAERPLPGEGAATFSAGAPSGPKKMGQLTVEDASLMHAEFENGALGSFEATRFATGRKNHNTFEIYGSEGSLTFDLERMNELQFYSRRDPPHAQGFRAVLATEGCHPYINRWWPPGHTIGYEHGFVHAVADFVAAIETGKPIAPNFADGVKTIAVLEAALASAASGKRMPVEHTTQTTGAKNEYAKAGV